MIPNAAKHNPDPAYLRGLIGRVDMTKKEVATAIGISPRLLRQYTMLDRAAPSAREAPYAVQFALEILAKKSAA